MCVPGRRRPELSRRLAGGWDLPFGTSCGLRNAVPVRVRKCFSVSSQADATQRSTMPLPCRRCAPRTRRPRLPANRQLRPGRPRCRDGFAKIPAMEVLATVTEEEAVTARSTVLRPDHTIASSAVTRARIGSAETPEEV